MVYLSSNYYVSFYRGLTGFCFLKSSQSHLMGKIPEKVENMILLEFPD